jgi:conjugative relaxase-like TrwC/TraI family protein
MSVCFHMLTVTQGKSVASTQQYFDQVLTQGDYYLGQELSGRWHGKGTQTLGIKHGSDVTKQQFNALLQGIHPETGQPLTQRTRKDRRPGVDLTFSVPKSVSLAWAINEDERIVEVLRQAVHETMASDVEPLMQRRVRQGQHAFTKQKTHTGKLIYADFLHKTGRPVDGSADPHLHIHAFVINWTEQDGRHYAGEFEEIMRQRPSLQAKFEARLARRLQLELGYGVEHVRFAQAGKLKAGWEISGLDRKTIEKFSRRTAQVEQYAKEHGIQDPEKKAQLGARTREKKETGESIEQLRKEWRSRLADAEREAFGRLTDAAGKGSETMQRDAASSVQYALEHHLYRQSTVERHQIVGTALEHGLTLTPEEIERAVDNAGVIQRTLDVEGSKRQLVTTREVLEAEQRMIAFARDGRGTRRAIASQSHEFKREWLNDHQQAAVNHVLQSRDNVVAIAGGAGTGKSSLMQEAAEGVAKNGKEVFTFAPSSGGRDVLQEKGFKEAETVEHLIRNTKLQEQVKDQVLWIDEAGLLDVRSMNKVFEIAKQQNARVVLSGDTRQHASPRRGEAMRLLEQEAGLKIARVEAIQRQKGQYLQAVEMISKGQEVVDEQGRTGLLAGYDLLDKLGKIKELPREERNEQLAGDYFQAKDKGKSSLVVAPTHAEAAGVTEEIRSRLKREGKLSELEVSIPQYRSLNLTEAQKTQASTYDRQDDLVVQFHQNTKGGFKRGERYRVAGAMGKEVRLVNVHDENDIKSLPSSHPDRFEVYTETELKISKGDKVRFTLGGKSREGTRIANGHLDEVKKFDLQGNLVLRSGKTVNRDCAHLDLGYVITSHASQGKDRDVAIAAMGSESLPAINAKQFYVTVSRGREDVAIYVDDKEQVRKAIARSGEQMSATAMLDAAEPGEAKAVSPSRDGERRQRQARTEFRQRAMRWWRGQGKADVQRHPIAEQNTGLQGPQFGRSREL